MVGIRYHRPGFTLVEIMIVIAVIALLAAVSIPVFLRARIQADETSAIASLRTISTACVGYRSIQSPLTYPNSLNELSITTPPYIDQILGSGAKEGYNFTYTLVSPDQYTVTASPVTPNVTGIRIFFLDESGVIKVDNAAGAPVE
ncbi:MAG: hypothetical protein A3F87_03085 [Omnitrophica WOR_2 bacterium RIFCSPLOWO2_12_FULL_51_24]|nr:MAG: hypothetical protein A2879_04820 [Omnitrophica WOR_2 bacterium RIFCSPHIGHO2_01_FULL_49_10]OGX42604.1 MAG: hypothetical protein A3F87_03085 [Omnitrophica WOR_2 bacterium RIFCSPLOWO2_12_FULL_51_24]